MTRRKTVKNPPYAIFIPQNGLSFYFLGAQNYKIVQKIETFDIKESLDVKGLKNVFF